MESFSAWHGLVLLAIVILPIWLMSKVLAKAGLSGWWALIGLVPLVNLAALWVFAFAKWPRLPQR